MFSPIFVAVFLVQYSYIVVCAQDKSSFCGGNSTKATSGINGAGKFQQQKSDEKWTVTTFNGLMDINITNIFGSFFAFFCVAS